MATGASSAIGKTGTVCAYTIYNLGVGIIIGLVRTIIAIAYVAKHAFYAKLYEQASQQAKTVRHNKNFEKQQNREQAVANAANKVEGAEGPKKVEAWIGGKLAQVSHGVGAVKDKIVLDVKDAIQEVQVTAVEAFEDTRKEAGYGQLARGLSEIVYVGAPYYTYQDNFYEHQVALFGYRELRQLIEDENQS